MQRTYPTTYMGRIIDSKLKVDESASYAGDMPQAGVALRAADVALFAAMSDQGNWTVNVLDEATGKVIFRAIGRNWGRSVRRLPLKRRVRKVDDQA